MNALNIGTGVEAVVLSDLGAKQTYHFDLSNRAVKNLKRYQKIKNIETYIQIEKIS